ncbi:MAG: hypothetical protein U0Z70_13485 [Thermomicrobiales bacterium]|nr:hypothetical protein [Chloroflexia bacterium]
MLGSAIGALSDRMDSRFVTAYWVPAFVFVLGALCAFGVMRGPGQIDSWISDLDSVEQTLGVVIIVLLVSTLAFILRALTRPITEACAGLAIPAPVAAWSKRGQLRAKRRAAQLLASSTHLKSPDVESPVAALLQNRFPENDADLQPTLFGNLIASASAHPRIAYSMEGLLWWSRLSPLLPQSFQDTLAGAQAPMMALFNLSIVFLALAVLNVLLGALTSSWLTAIVFAVVSLVLARLSYRAAVSQAAEVSSMLRVAFDLYRYDILDQLGRPHPETIADERALWTSITREVLGLEKLPPAS